MSKGTASVRTREELRMSLINRRRELAQMEAANWGEDATIDFSLWLMDHRRSRTSKEGSLVSP